MICVFIIAPTPMMRMANTRASSDCVKTFCLHNGQELERWSAGPLFAALPLADELRLHIEIMGEHTLAHSGAFADRSDLFGR